MTMPLEAAAADLDVQRIPHHVAIIMDGNRRWAKRRGLPAIEGHRRGIVALREVTRAASDLGVPIVTVYGFSTENWRRDSNEISFLFELCVYFAKTELAELNKNNVRVRIIGDWHAFPDSARNALAKLQEQTQTNTGLILNLAVNYSSRAELVRAIRSIAADVEAGRLREDEIDEARIESYLYTAGIPDPDVLIRPGGEHRLSNFLLYQAAYTELVMTDVFWPDFTRAEFANALREYQQRQRRYGS
ncbi:MAG TPA: isoprenyl transferase [Candidatus Baltobacteraceae bacterium]|nr:isoprenyl transferase [Candidatus Baltobacteraceae bacterium]